MIKPQLPKNIMPSDKDWHQFHFGLDDKLYMGVIVGVYDSGEYCYLFNQTNQQGKPIFAKLPADFVDEYFDPSTCTVPPAYQEFMSKPE